MINNEILQKIKLLLSEENVISEQEDLVTYSFDATADLASTMPDVVVTPRNTEDIVEIIKIAGQYKIPIYPRGSGTNLSGGTIPLKGGIVILFTKMKNIIEVDTENLTATVEPGVIIQELNSEVAVHGLIYPPDPGTVATATMGGSVSECSGGLRGLKYGVTKHYVMGLKVVLANGEVVKWGGKTVKNVTSYDLVKLFTGAEGTLGIITEIIVKLIPAPEFRRSMFATFNNLADAGNAVSEIVKNKVIPATLEIMDNMTIQTVENYSKIGLPVNAEAILLIEVDGIKEVVEREAEIVANVVKKNQGELKIAYTEKERDDLWAARRAALPALAQVSPTTVLEDATVPRSEITKMLIALQEIAKKYDLKIGTFGHAGDGNLHPTILTDERNKEEMARVHKAVDEIFEVALKLGGTLTGEHGIGIAKMGYIEKEFGTSGTALLARIKEALDPDFIMNPGKIVPIKGEK